jgi:hypothetical protein
LSSLLERLNERGSRSAKRSRVFFFFFLANDWMRLCSGRELVIAGGTVADTGVNLTRLEGRGLVVMFVERVEA